MKGWCLNHSTKGPLAPQAGFEPATFRLTAGCSTVELLRNRKGGSAWGRLGNSQTSERSGRQRPILPPRLQGSTFGAGGLNGRVRYGYGCFPSAMATSLLPQNRIDARKASANSYPSAPRVAALPPRADLPRRLQGALPGSPGGTPHLGAGFALRCLQRLSLRAWLPGCAPGRTTGAPVARTLRSSRTRSLPPQVSCARDR